ncbi:hypothetical protein [Lysinibacillus sphaericus]|uniref:Uncharacterized protein n=1 Tax=Lysinibacillus sphaericus OT4b.31 TaxID=1285586 RepID=R7Z9N9_LYSSH|nr:hypothetical protein [Lysinibacillus sphaericus]EON70875.1 hypothetical protein H131_19407 [Lysinibacillus sphaericus OT4b.31]
MGIEFTALHRVYVVFIVLIIGSMVKRRDTILICILGIFILVIEATGIFVIGTYYWIFIYCCFVDIINTKNLGVGN